MVYYIMFTILTIYTKWIRLACCIYMPHWQRRVNCRLYIVQQTTTLGSHIPTINLPTIGPWSPLHVRTTGQQIGHRENFTYQGNHSNTKSTIDNPHCPRGCLCCTAGNYGSANYCWRPGGRGCGIVTCGSCAHGPPPIPLAHRRVPGDVRHQRQIMERFFVHRNLRGRLLSHCRWPNHLQRR